MRRNKLLRLTKGIIALLLVSSMQMVTAQANKASLFLSDSAEPCSMSLTHTSSNKNQEHSGSNSQQMDHSCSHCNSITSHCQNNCNIGSSMVIPVNAGTELEIKPVSAFYARITFPPTLLQQPNLRPPRL